MKGKSIKVFRSKNRQHLHGFGVGKKFNSPEKTAKDKSNNYSEITEHRRNISSSVCIELPYWRQILLDLEDLVSVLVLWCECMSPQHSYWNSIHISLMELWGIGEVMRAPSYWMHWHSYRKTQWHHPSLFLVLFCSFHLVDLTIGAMLEEETKTLTRHQICSALTLDLPAFITVRN